MNTIYFTCKEKDFKFIDSFLAEQEYYAKPNFNNIVIKVGEMLYNYSIKYEFNKYYIVAN